VNRALPDAELDNFVDALATRIASFDKWAIANTKRLVNEASRKGSKSSWSKGSNSLKTRKIDSDSTWDSWAARASAESERPSATSKPSPLSTPTSARPPQISTVGTAVSLQIQASDSASGQTLTYSATGLPTGLSIASGTGLISGTPTTAGTYSTTVTVGDAAGASGSTSFTWTVNQFGGCIVIGQLGASVTPIANLDSRRAGFARAVETLCVDVDTVTGGRDRAEPQRPLQPEPGAHGSV
jgi:hypothetical protein